MSKQDELTKLPDAEEGALTKCVRETREAINTLILNHDCRILMACILAEAGKIGGDAVRSGVINMADVKQYFNGAFLGAIATSKNKKPARVTNGKLDTKPN